MWSTQSNEASFRTGETPNSVPKTSVVTHVACLLPQQIYSFLLLSFGRKVTVLQWAVCIPMDINTPLEFSKQFP